MGDYLAAEARAEALLDEGLAAEPLARTLTAAASVDLARYRLERAEDRAHRGLTAARTTGDLNLEARASAAVAEIMLERGAKVEATLRSFTRVRDLAAESGNDGLLAWAETELGFVRWWNLREIHDPIAEIFAPTLAAARKAGEPVVTAHVLDRIANTWLRMDDLLAFFETQERALELWEGLGNRARQASAHLQFGWAWDRLENPRRAFRHYQKALVLAAESGYTLLIPRGHRHLAAAELRSGHSELAAERLEDLVAGALPWRDEGPSIFGVLGDAYRRLGKLPQAHAAYERSIALNPLGDVSFRVWIESGRAKTALIAGEIEQAQQLLAQLEGWVGPRSDWSDRRRVLLLRAAVLRRSAGNEAALAPLLEAAEIETRSLGSVGTLTPDIGLGVLNQLLPRLLASEPPAGATDMAAATSKGAHAGPWAAEAFRLLEQARLRPKRQLQLAHRTPSIDVGGSRLQEEVAALAAARRAASAAAIKASPESFAELREAYSRYEDEVFRTHLDTDRAPIGRGATVGEVQQQLQQMASEEGSAKTAIVAYVLVRELAAAFVLRADRFDLLPLPFQPAELRPRVKILRHCLNARQGSAWRSPARELGRLLLGPLEDQASLEGIDRLLIVPMGELHELPFGVLLDQAGRPWIERIAIAVVPAASTILESGRHPTEPGLVLGRERFEDDMLPELSAARREAEAVAQSSGARLVFGQEASEQAFRRLAPNASRLHLVTHARVEPELPSLSRLVLAPRRDSAALPSTDGELTVGELLELDLQAELVTLSACRSGLALPATRRLGTELRRTGLVEGFLLAGARNVLGTLFPVEDEATANFMVDFENELREHPPIVALTTVQRRLAAGTGPASHPGHWAAFVLSGPGTLTANVAPAGATSKF
ncbi:MAG: CHAT domain-containing tetratricopeptide repeat protein [Acidobacteriota bacterium]